MPEPMQKLMDSTRQIRNQSILAWDQQIVGYTCSFVPGEIFYAADILPVRLRGIETTGMDIGDAYFGPFICTFPKCILQLAGEKQLDFLDGVIITPGCDAMRRLDECWRKAGEDHPGITPGFFFHFGVPHKITDYSLQWFMEEMNRLIKAVEEHFKVKISTRQLKDAISRYNLGRRLLARLEDFRTPENFKLTGSQAFAAAVASTVMPRDEYISTLEDLIKELEQTRPEISNKKRIMLVGSISDDLVLLDLIEAAGAMVVAENLCFGLRYESDQVSEDEEPITALARRYLSHSICPRMFGAFEQRLAVLKEKIKISKVDAVIMQNIRFCDLHGSENGLFERELEKIGIPCIRIEREYGGNVESGRMRMRIDAFLERIT